MAAKKESANEKVVKIHVIPTPPPTPKVVTVQVMPAAGQPDEQTSGAEERRMARKRISRKDLCNGMTEDLCQLFERAWDESPTTSDGRKDEALLRRMIELLNDAEKALGKRKSQKLWKDFSGLIVRSLNEAHNNWRFTFANVRP